MRADPPVEREVPLPACGVAGLHWVSDALPGIRRRRSGAGFSYLCSDGRPLRDAATLERIRRLAIPPAWREVWICPRTDGHLQATGVDARGRKQYLYHVQWQAERSKTKFAHLLEFGLALPRIRARVVRALARPGEPTRLHLLATLVRLLDATWMRIGNAEYARSNGSYGLSTLRRRHAELRGADLQLSYVGKSGVRHEVRLSDRQVARVVRRCLDLPGQELFQYRDGQGAVNRVDSTDVNDWMAEVAGYRVTAKDFRTWHASALALELILDACAAAHTGSASPARPQELLAAVARRLGNTPAVCGRSYVHPRVMALGSELADANARKALLGRAWVRRAPAVRGLCAAERRLVGLLRESRRSRQTRRS